MTPHPVKTEAWPDGIVIHSSTPSTPTETPAPATPEPSEEPAKTLAVVASDATTAKKETK